MAMRRILALTLACSMAFEAPVQASGRLAAAVAASGSLGVRVNIAPVAAMPTLTPVLPSSFLAPLLTPTLAAPAFVSPAPILAAVAATPSALPAVAAAAKLPAPASTRETLTVVEAALGEPPAAPRSASAGWATASRAFDTGSIPSAGATAVPALTVSSPRLGLSRPTLRANHVSGRAGPEAPRSQARKRFFEFAETAVAGAVPALSAGLLVPWLGGSVWLAPAMAMAAHAASSVMFSSLGAARGVVVDGWQASHDQRYRVGGDGRLRDVRGHKYGADRYERYAPGAVGTTASRLIRASAFAVGALWLLGAAPAAYALYAGAFASLEAVSAWARARAQRPAGPISDEGRAHAARFRNGITDSAASQVELDSVSGAAFALAQLADDIGAEAGMLVSRMKGSDFIATVAEAGSRLDAAAAEPSRRAAAAAKAVRAATLRLVRALVKPEAPMALQSVRLMAVWQVLNQELLSAAVAGGIDAVVADAELFAVQVEGSIPR